MQFQALINMWVGCMNELFNQFDSFANHIHLGFWAIGIMGDLGNLIKKGPAQEVPMGNDQPDIRGVLCSKVTLLREFQWVFVEQDT